MPTTYKLTWITAEDCWAWISSTGERMALEGQTEFESIAEATIGVEEHHDITITV